MVWRITRQKRHLLRWNKPIDCSTRTVHAEKNGRYIQSMGSSGKTPVIQYLPHALRAENRSTDEEMEKHLVYRNFAPQQIHRSPEFLLNIYYNVCEGKQSSWEEEQVRAGSRVYTIGKTIFAPEWHAGALRNRSTLRFREDPASVLNQERGHPRQQVRCAPALRYRNWNYPKRIRGLPYGRRGLKSIVCTSDVGVRAGVPMCMGRQESFSRT